MKLFNMKKTGFIPFALLVTLLPLVSACNQKPAEEMAKAFSLSDTMFAKCSFYEATHEAVKNEIRLFGKIAVDNNKLAQVYPVVGGNILSIDAELGDYVHRGQVLATVRSTEVAEFNKQQLDAKSDVAVAEKNLQVAQDLFAGKLNSERDVIAAQIELDKANAALKRINEIYGIYGIGKGSTYNITAPINGFILSKNIYPNELLRADISEPLFSISEINEVWAVANVSESDIAKIKIGYDAEVRTLGFPDVPYHGKIDKIINAIDPETKAMKARVKIPNNNFELKPDMMATVHVYYTEDERMIAIPSSAVLFDKSKYWVMIYRNRTDIETRQVDVYRQLNGISYIRNGIKNGETVISKNALFIYDALND